MTNVRGRYAPSPTGHQTVGNARTAILAWLDVRSRGGEFVLRLDDTDPARESVTPEDVTAPLHALGLDWDEGWDKGGPYAPYVVSERVERHRAAAAGLEAAGLAYWDYTPPIADVGAHKASRGELMKGRSAHRGTPQPVEGVDPVLRLKILDGETVTVTDRVFGEISVASDDLGEVALLRADGRPTYHLASCVDDVDMAITTVVRGADWLNYLPQHVLVFRALGDSLPEFAHVPLLVGSDGQKLSKRYGDLSIRHLLGEDGIPAGALVAYLANLGFEERSDLPTLAEMAPDFDLSRMGKASPRYDPKKLQALCRRWIGEREPLERVAAEIRERSGVPLTDAELAALAPGIKPRVHSFAMAAELTQFLGAPDSAARDGEMVPDRLVDEILATEPWDADDLAATIDRLIPSDDPDRKVRLKGLRDALAPGFKVTPPLHHLLAALGRDRAAARLAAV